MPVSVAPIVPRGMLFSGFLRSPDRPSPAIIPVNAGKHVANTVPKLSPPWIRAVRLSPSGRIDSGPLPSRKAAIEAARIALTTQSTRTPRSAPLVRISATSSTVEGRLTQRGSGSMP